jgi:hypothetical protein
MRLVRSPPPERSAAPGLFYRSRVGTDVVSRFNDPIPLDRSLSSPLSIQHRARSQFTWALRIRTRREAAWQLAGLFRSAHRYCGVGPLSYQVGAPYHGRCEFSARSSYA